MARIPSARIPVDVMTLPVGSSRPADQTVFAGNGWELTVRASYDFHTLLANVPRFMSVQFSKVLNDKGAGTVVLNLDDAIWGSTLGDGTPGNNLIDFENLWEVWKDGVLVFDFLGETITEELVNEGESRTVTITGPGTLACLGWGIVMPPGFPVIKFKTDAMQDGFAEVDENGNPALDTNLWNATSVSGVSLDPLGSVKIKGAPAGTFLGASPFDLSNSIVSAQVTPIPQSNVVSNTDGSQISQFFISDNVTGTAFAMIAVSADEMYLKFVGRDGHVQTKSLGNYDPNGDLYWMFSHVTAGTAVSSTDVVTQGTFFFWTSADGQSWVKRWTIPSAWVPDDITVYFAAVYSDSSQFVTVTNLNGNVVTPTSAGNIYVHQPSMGVWKQLFDAAQARGTIGFISSSLNRDHDSFGNPWIDSVSQQVQLGTDLFSLLQGFAAVVNADFIMQPGFQLQVGRTVSLAGGASLGDDLSHYVILREGAQEVTKERVRARDSIANLVGAVNSDGTVVSYTDSPSIATFGQREGWVQTATQVNPESMDVVVQASVDQTKDETLSWTLSITSDFPGCTPFRDFDVGDWIGQERPGPGGSTIDAIRCIGIAMSIDAQGLTTTELTLNSYRQWLAEQLVWLVNKFGGQFLNTIGSTPVTTNAANPNAFPIVTAPSLGGLGDVSIS